MGIKRGTTLAAVAVVVALTATACGGDDTKAADAAQPVAAASSQSKAGEYGDANAAGNAANAAAKTGAGQLAIADNEKVGSFLADSEGRTLYRFDKDTAKPPKSNCEGDCEKTWPVVAAGDVTAAAGMDASLLGEVVRSDGTKQLTVAGWPAYRYAKDEKAGDVNGQGVGGVWFALAPDGKKAAKAAAPAAPEAPAKGQEGALTVAKDPKLGDHVVDGKGMTVYRFKPDTAWPMVSKCTGDCLAKWPVVAPQDKGEGIIEKNYLVLDRPDGKKQQTVNCWPVYTFTGDKKPGDVNGQGVGGTWYAVAPDGKLITAK
ncbi:MULTISPECIES: SCO0930 family lipoprotein [unclassified Streptomyces]|uniref:SCO0930 family lipoprotein n=1 Tax=unclassified Streptomyces TaxID=2593676 RepID=UPI00225C262B|nr:MULTISPECIES: SCO0930 family lipoprotein [unclassified Streptomyces]MCX4524770.1 SCO0930 family lipoprotein [Streptomyces sp. NBC_01551]MCX4544719.1 SCO0930 family lipoprotein [Streptomyces sp. NBC_01565]